MIHEARLGKGCRGLSSAPRTIPLQHAFRSARGRGLRGPLHGGATARWPVAFGDARPLPVPPGDAVDHDGRWIVAGLAAARAQWPAVAVADHVIASHVEQKWTATHFAKLRLPELFLACACAHRDPAAIALFEGAYFSEIDTVVSRFPSLPLTNDDIRQKLRESLYLRDPPALAGFDGRGSLRHWFRAAVLHAVLNVASRENRENPTEAEFFDKVVNPGGTAETAYLKIACGIEFREAFLRALEHLTSRERVLLQYAYSDGMNVDRIGAIFRVHRATTARWISAARDHLVERTHAELATRLALAPDEVSSIVRAALSGIGTTLLRRIAPS